MDATRILRNKSVLMRSMKVLGTLVFILAIAGFPMAQVPNVAQAAPLGWRDDFKGKTLGPGWFWVNEDAGMWSLTERPGFLRIYTSPGPTGSQNLLLRPVGVGDFAIQTRMFFKPSADFQFAGLVIYQDDGNFLQFGRAFCDVPETCVGNGIYFDEIPGGGFVDGNFATHTTIPDKAFLRLVRQGQTITGFYSANGITWQEIGAHEIPEDFVVNGVGLTSSQNIDVNTPAVPADFDYFTLEAPPSPGAYIVASIVLNWVWTSGFIPEGLQTLSIYASAEPGAMLLWRGSKVADDSGFVFFESWEHNVDLVPGNYLVVSDGITTKNLVLETIRIAVFDPDHEIMIGTATGGKEVWVVAGMAAAETQGVINVIAEPDTGIWTADFNTIGFDITEEMRPWSFAQIPDEDGDASEDDPPAAPQPPVGFHDGEQGDVRSTACNAGGWAYDPDSPFDNVDVRIMADGNEVIGNLKAENYRQDLEDAWNNGSGGCPGGHCAFNASLWGLVSANEPHEIVVEAQDLQTGEWYPLYSTPKSLTCMGYPEGFHDGAEGIVDPPNCTAFGWAVDPDNTDRDVEVRVLSDGNPVTSLIASDYRNDMDILGICPEGTCGFTVNLWTLISPGREHQITAQAFDEETGEWLNLSATPKSLSCRSVIMPHFRLPADAGWVDSGYNMYAGAPVRITAYGEAITAPLRNHWDSRSGPDGQDSICPNYEGAPPCALDGAPYGALVGKIGLDGSPFLIASNLTFTPEFSGDLYLAVNDNLPYYDDNLGNYMVFFNR
jgi:hypothetical protein